MMMHTVYISNGTCNEAASLARQTCHRVVIPQEVARPQLNVSSFSLFYEYLVRDREGAYGPAISCMLDTTVERYVHRAH